MKKAIFKISEGKPEIFNDIKKQEIFEHINNNQYTGKDARLSHKQRVITYKEGLEAMEKTKICPYCKDVLVLRSGKYGEFYACKNYPKCRYTLKR